MKLVLTIVLSLFAALSASLTSGFVYQPVAARGAAEFPLTIAFKPSVAKATAFRGDGAWHVSYEYLVSNYTKTPVRLVSLQVTGELAGQDVYAAKYTGAQLAAIYSSIAGNHNQPQDPLLPPGASATLFLFLDFAGATPVPERLAHRIEVQIEGDDTTLQTLKGDDIRIGSGLPTIIGPPLKGTNWWTPNGPSNHSIHRRTTIVIDGNVTHTEQFAVDWVKLGPNGATFAGDPALNESYFAYKEEVIAATEGRVVSVLDGLPDSVPNQPTPFPLSVATIAGNHVVVDIGGGKYALYAHLTPNTVRVAVGERVRRGQVLGLLGNSGNSTQPHLHFHLMSGPEPLGSRGLPFMLDRFVRKPYRIVCAPGQNCDPLDGPTRIVVGLGQWVWAETFMNDNLGDFRK